jgi:hypothetical protein
MAARTARNAARLLVGALTSCPTRLEIGWYHWRGANTTPKPARAVRCRARSHLFAVGVADEAISTEGAFIYLNREKLSEVRKIGRKAVAGINKKSRDPFSPGINACVCLRWGQGDSDVVHIKCIIRMKEDPTIVPGLPCAAPTPTE